MILAFIYQWGDRPVGRSDLIKITLVIILIGLFLGRFKVIINDHFAIFRSDIWVPIRIPISMIVSVHIKKAALMEASFPWDKVKNYYFDFVEQAVSIQTRSGKVYQIAIKDAQRIKEEIEKRMLITNHKHQYDE
jgi:hypothetical protein